MNQETPILRKDNSKVSWNIVLKSPHAVAYRLWTKLNGTAWEIIAEGGLSDEKIDAGEFDAVRGIEFAHWFGIGSDKPQSKFDVSVVLSQENFILGNGLMQERGRVNDEGIAIRLESVSIK